MLLFEKALQICYYSVGGTGIFANRLSFLVLFICTYIYRYVVKRDQSKFAWACYKGAIWAWVGVWATVFANEHYCPLIERGTSACENTHHQEQTRTPQHAYKREIKNIIKTERLMTTCHKNQSNPIAERGGGGEEGGEWREGGVVMHVGAPAGPKIKAR